MRLVDDEDVERVPRARSWCSPPARTRRAAAAGRAACGSHAMDTITRGKSWNGLACSPWVRRTSRHQVAVDDREVQTELLAHLVLPLQGQARRADDRRGAGAVPQQQLLHHEASLDGLAQADVVGEQQVGPGRLTAHGAAARAGRPRRSRRCGTGPGRRSASAEVTAPQRIASTNAASVFGSSKRVGVDASRQSLGGVTVWPTSSSQTTVSSSPSRSSSRDWRVTAWFGEATASSAGLRGRPCGLTSLPPRSTRVPRRPDPAREWQVRRPPTWRPPWWAQVSPQHPNLRAYTISPLLWWRSPTESASGRPNRPCCPPAAG